MAKIFLSHSSKDKDFVRELACDLKTLGHTVWLDEWEIKVGDCIVSKIQEGLAESHYVILVLSKHAVDSGWVDKEWKTKYGQEIKSHRVILLPILLEDCTIPLLLQTKKYADFRINHRVGLAQLVTAIQPVINNDDLAIRPISETKQDDWAQGVTRILSQIHSAEIPLSQSLANSVGLAQQLGNKRLKQFCEKELLGYDKLDNSAVWRKVHAYCSVTAEINLQYIGFAGNAGLAFEEMASDPKHFFSKQLFIPYAVPTLEHCQPSNPRTNILILKLSVSDFLKKAKNPNAPVNAYMKADTYQSVLLAIKMELSGRLLQLLPSVSLEGNLCELPDIRTGNPNSVS